MARSKRKQKDISEEASVSGEAEPKVSDSQSVEQEPQQPPAAHRPGWTAAGLAALILFFVLAFLFRESFLPSTVLFANDAPFGFIKHIFENGRDGWGGWIDHLWLGYAQPAAGPCFTTFFAIMCAESGDQGALNYANFYTPACLWVLGMCAWVFFRQLNCGSAVCLLGALAAALNGAFFTYATWGLPVRALAAGMTFLALAALASGGGRRWWPAAVLAGLAVGQGVMEAYDIGALFSLYAAAYAAFMVLSREGWSLPSLGRGVTVVGVMAIMAGLTAYHSISSVRETQTKGIVNQEMSKEEKWDFATQWSLPKDETMRIAVPGLFGHREMDGPINERYWGRVPFSGYGVYAGIPVLLVAVWCIVNAFRRDGPYTVPERSFIYFTAVLALVSLGMAWGKHSVFFKGIHWLPFFKDIRNPIKFMQPFSLLVVILFGLGLQGLARLYLEDARERMREAGGTLRDLVNPVRGFEPAWLLGSVLGFMVLTACVLAYTASEGEVVKHITQNPVFQNRMVMESVQDPQAMAGAMASFSFGQALWALLVLFLSLVLLFVISSGRIARGNALTFWVVLGVLMVVDLSRGHTHYIKYWDHQAKYPENSILKFLADQPGHERVKLLQRERVPVRSAGSQTALWAMDSYVIARIMHPVPQGNQVFTNDYQIKTANSFYKSLFQYPTAKKIGEFIELRDEIFNSQVEPDANLKQKFSTMPGGEEFVRMSVGPRRDPLVQQYLREKLAERVNQLETFKFANDLLNIGYEEWAQHQMPYHDVSTLDIVQEPRPLKADRAFRTNFAPAVVRDQKESIRLTLRKWELTATRYLLCASGNTNATRLARERIGILGYANALNFFYDPAHRRFNTVKSFNLKPVANTLPKRNPEPNDPVNYTYQVEEDINGMGALVEFDGALPRAKLFADWRQDVADSETLKILASPGFNPQRQVILAEEGLPEPDMPARTSQLGPVEYVANRAKYVELKTPPTKMHTVLLLNDRHNPDWQVTVDGKPARLLRANFLMRGVHLEPSKEGHTVVFRYLPSTTPLMVSSAAGLIGLIFGVVGLCRCKED